MTDALEVSASWQGPAYKKKRPGKEPPAAVWLLLQVLVVGCSVRASTCWRRVPGGVPRTVGTPLNRVEKSVFFRTCSKHPHGGAASVVACNAGQQVLRNSEPSMNTPQLRRWPELIRSGASWLVSGTAIRGARRPAL